jgi:hypothetical protein
MKATIIHTKADSHGIVHLDLSVAPPHSEVYLSLAVTYIEPPSTISSLIFCDRRFFASLFGDRIYSRKSQAH